ncbi:MAG: T9SS type A sorting domain-containing protein [Bacteroidales bacterium]|nr:T9SS type A sorting domain-containing protein [Bacteroidales bacterium]
MYTAISNVSKLLSTSSAPANEVEAEFNKLAAESAEWKSLEADFNELNQKKNELLLRINQNLTNMTSTLAEVSNDVIALDVFRRDAFTGNSKRDLNAMQYLEKMEQRAKNRLLKYHYYLRKAYEYRLLKPYEGEFNLVGMFDRFEALGLTLDSIVDPAAHSSLKSVFREVVSEIAEEIIDEYSNNTPEQSAPITIVIPRDQLDILNEYGNLTLNFYEMGIFSPDEENVRIVNLSVEHLGSHVNGNIGYSGYMDLNMTHQGISRFRKNGQIYWFDHISRTTTSPHTWGTRYDAITQTYTPIQPSYASSSLLYSLLNNNNSNMMLFSRPSAWGDINVTKKVHTSGGADIVIDSLVLRLQYDFTQRPANIRNIDITTNEGLLPYIACSAVDRNGRSNGNGNLNRSYNESYQTVTFSAIEQYGTWHFLNWTDRAGNIVSDSMDLTVSRSTDQFYRANYERRVPILSVPDTIFVNSTGGVYSVPVANVGSGDIEMDWYVSDSLSTWVHLNGLVDGFDNGNFSFTYEDNETESYRLDSLEIFAPETDIMSKMIYIVQNFTPSCNLTASVTPTSVTICEGEDATVTASGQSSLGNQFSYRWNTGETTPTISVHSGGERIVTVSDSNGCTATASVNVTVNPSPNLNISGDNSFCQGGSVSLIASGASSYSWSNGSNNATITISNPGTYMVIGTNATGCSATASKTVTVNPTYFIPLTESICQGETYNFNGQYLTTAGTYTQNLSTVNGCDSIITLTLTVKALPTTTISGNTMLCQGQSTILTATGGVSYNWNNGYTSNNIPVSQSGIYTVTATNAEGCSATANVTVTVNPLPTVTITGNSTICQGSSTSLTATGANTYSWSTGDNTASVSINAFGIYTVTGTSAEGCSNTANVTVLVSQLPVITITGETDICAGESTTLTANGGDTYLWSNGSTDNTLTVNLAGIYQVIGYNAAGCSNMADATVSVWQPATSEFTVECPEPCYEWNGESYCQSGDYTETLQTVHGCDSVVTLHLTITVGIENHDYAASMTVYPNPTNGIVNVQFTDHNSPITQIHVYDVYGKLVGVNVVGTNDDSPLQLATAQIDLSRYANGVYFIKAAANGHVMGVRKVVKQ